MFLNILIRCLRASRIYSYEQACRRRKREWGYGAAQHSCHCSVYRAFVSQQKHCGPILLLNILKKSLCMLIPNRGCMVDKESETLLILSLLLFSCNRGGIYA